ncbi:MAG: MBL fold metallo-hydrolase [Kiritimatiellae bacterium]|nr:MBL fold metallo-hydrolase [Kiritimatiellia bacterium]
MRLVSLASSSAGNAYCVESGGRVLLIDCGLSWSDFKSRYGSAGFSLDALEGVLLTHNHIDHVRGLATLHRKLPEVPLFANLMTSEATASVLKMDEADFFAFENGQSFTAGPFTVSPFSIPHDVPDPVGYMVEAEGLKYFHATDVGMPLDSIGVHLADADCATLESNHDPVMVMESARPPLLKRRILGPRGHLSNADAADLVARFASPRLKELRLAHLSAECNAPAIAEREMREALASISRPDVILRILPPDSIL